MGTAVTLAVLATSPSLSPARAESNGTELQELESEAQQGRKEAERLSAEAQKLEEDLRSLRGHLIIAARKIQDYESELTAIEETLITLNQEEARKAKALKHDRTQLSQTLSALQRIALLPPEALAAAPGSPLDTVRSAMLLQVAVPEIENRVVGLRNDLASLSELRDRISEEQNDLLRARKQLRKEQEGLNQLISRKKKLQSQTLASQKKIRARVEKLARQAKDMKDLVRRLEEERKRLAQNAPRPKPKPAQAPSSTQQTSTPQGETAQKSIEIGEASQIAMVPQADQIRKFPSRRKKVLLRPARGKVISRFGQKNGRNQSLDQGLVIATRPAAQVVAPYDGRVAYAGEFRGYGRILIIEHSGGYHTLLAGVERIDVTEGQWVLAGEPVGRMSADSAHQPEIYLELRRDGQPVNPLPWLVAKSKAQNLNKVNG